MRNKLSVLFNAIGLTVLSIASSNVLAVQSTVNPPVVLTAPTVKKNPTLPPPLPSSTLSTAALATISEYLALDLNNLFTYSSPALPSYYALTQQIPTPGITPFVVADNTPNNNKITNQGATLGRVLFNDVRLSFNNTTSCASCHQQSAGFSDVRKLSLGALPNTIGTMHAMRIGNASFYRPGSMFWDKRSPSMEAQSTQPIQNINEMGFDASHGGINALITKMQTLPYYLALFQWVYGTPAITEVRIQQALAQYERSMFSFGSKWDTGFAKVYDPNAIDKGLNTNLPNLTEQENIGRNLFMALPAKGGVGCSGCHVPPTFSLAAGSLSNGLDAGATIVFKSPSLKNVGVTTAFMHDGRFSTLEQVVDHYDHGVKAGPSLDPHLLNQQGQPRILNLSAANKAALVAFMKTLTDTKFLIDPRFSDPFKK